MSEDNPSEKVSIYDSKTPSKENFTEIHQNND